MRPDEKEHYDEAAHHLLPSESQRWNGKKPWLRISVIFNFLLAFILLIASPLAYQMGVKHGETTLPKLPTDPFTRDALKFELTMLDDEFKLHNPENERFKGVPRPELDDAWKDLVQGVNLRVPGDLAKQAGFNSIELMDGSGDVWGSPSVYHNLHCLKSIRQSFFPEMYPDWKINHPDENGALSPHMDHCIENIREALMCQADMSMYRYAWNDETSRPGLSHKDIPHVCANWKKLDHWAKAHSFSVYQEGLLVHPKYGVVNPPHFVGPAEEKNQTT